MEDSIIHPLPVEVSLGESDPLTEVPSWALWLSTLVLSLVFVVGLPLNGATVLIFWRRKKLRHLVNFVLLLDCLSHIILCLTCIPTQLVIGWSSGTLAAAGLTGISALQQVVGNFCNLYSTFLTASIAILRYRRLCWKKKDKFSTGNAIIGTILSAVIAATIISADSYSIFISEDEQTVLVLYSIKISLVLLSMLMIFYCYIRVSQRVWTNATNHEKLMDPIKLKKSRSVHLRATIHSCVQIFLMVLTITPYLYEVVGQTLRISYLSINKAIRSSELEPGSIHPRAFHRDSRTETFASDSGRGDDNWLNESQEISAEEAPPTSSTTISLDNDHLARLMGITINYALLILGTPMAYIASCHRFREQFATILFTNEGNSPKHSGFHNPNSPRHPDQRYQMACYSGIKGCRSFTHCSQAHSPVDIYPHYNELQYSSSETTRTTYFNGSSCKSKCRSSISISTNTPSTAVTICRSSGSTKSRTSSMKHGATARRKGSRGLLGSEFIIVDSESTAMLNEQDLSNSSNPKATPTPSPTMTEGTGGHEERKTSIYCTGYRSPLVPPTFEPKKRRSSLQTILQNYGYDFSDLGELV